MSDLDDLPVMEGLPICPRCKERSCYMGDGYCHKCRNEYQREYKRKKREAFNELKNRMELEAIRQNVVLPEKMGPPKSVLSDQAVPYDGPDFEKGEDVKQWLERKEREKHAQRT